MRINHFVPPELKIVQSDNCPLFDMTFNGIVELVTCLCHLTHIAGTDALHLIGYNYILEHFSSTPKIIVRDESFCSFKIMDIVIPDSNHTY